MGTKLGKMVKIFKILVFFFAINISADISTTINYIDINKMHSLEKEAQIFTLTASINGITNKQIRIAKPTASSIKALRPLSPRDRYALKVLDKDKKEITIIGLGDPFYIHAQHIGYEDSSFFGGYVEQDIEISLPMGIDASYFILLSEDNGDFKKIREIKANR